MVYERGARNFDTNLENEMIYQHSDFCKTKLETTSIKNRVQSLK